MGTGTPAVFRVWPFIVGGAFIGTGAACTGQSHGQQANQSYTSRLEFRVVIQDEPHAKHPEALIDAQISMAESLIHSREFLEEVIKAPEFHRRADGTAGDAAWTAAHKGNEIAALQRDLRFVRRSAINGFEISMSGSVAAEMPSLVAGAGRVVQERLNAASREAAETRIKTLANARAEAESGVDAARASLTAWSKSKEVDVTRTRYEVEKSALRQRTEEALRRMELGDAAGAERARAEQGRSAKIVVAMGETLMEYQKKVDELKSKEELLRSVQREIEYETATLSADMPHFEMGAPTAPAIDVSDSPR